MKGVFIAGVGAFALIAAVPFINYVPASVVAQSTQNQSQLQLRLEAQKQIITKDQQGKQKVVWQALQGKAVVKPGDVLRYTLSGENRSDRPIKNLTLNQPIPKGMVYVLKSAEIPNKEAKITYSIDGGRSFVENPTVKITLPNGRVEIKPAPASAYTNIRVVLPLIAARTTLKATYLTQVR